MRKPYKDSEGLLTIGYGTLIEDGLSTEEASLLLNAPSRKGGPESLRAARSVFRELPAPVQSALAQMAYNLGVPRLLKFSKMWAALRQG